MAQLQKGKLCNVFTKSDFTDKKTGEVTEGSSFLQFSESRTFKNDNKEFFYLNVKCDKPADFSGLIGKTILVCTQDSIYEGRKYVSVVPGTKPEVLP